MVAYWWLGLILVMATLFWGWILWRRRTRRADKAAKPLSHSTTYLQNPAYTQALKRYTLLRRLAWALFAVVWLCLALLASRPVSRAIVQPEQHNRDIMLCLDVSGSMSDVDAKLLQIFDDLVGHFKGERIGLMVFDSSPAMIFPLTSDYDYVHAQLQQTIKGLSSDSSFAQQDIASGGTYENYANGSSLVGDGVAGCLMRFDDLSVQRSRSIILATDNYVAGTPIITLEQGAAMAREKNVRIYGINPADRAGRSFADTKADSYKAAVLSTKGSYYTIDPYAGDHLKGLNDIITQISAQDATRFKGGPQIVDTDQPAIIIMLTAILVTGYCVILWRLRA